MTDKESLTHEIEDDLAARNRNWNKVDRNTTNIAENTTNLDDHMLKTTEDDVHGLANAVIVESGSNARGNYIKWGDGTMICMNHLLKLTYVQSNTLQSTWVYPVPFVNDNVTVLSTAIISPTSQDMNTTTALRSVQADSIRIALYSPSASWATGDTRNVSVVAIGSWK